MPVKENQQESLDMQYAKDEFGQEILLKDGDLQVMMAWEKPYMEACIEALKPSGDVLEIGFGLGYSAEKIQKFEPKSHTIIECAPVVIQKAREWAKKHSNIKIIEGYWEEQLEKLGIFDAIFFDDYTPLSEEGIKELQADSKILQQLEENAKKTSESLKMVFQEMKGIKFSDEQVVDFVKQLKSRQDTNAEDVKEFIQTLVERGNITAQQEVKFLDEYEKTDHSDEKSHKKLEVPKIAPMSQLSGDRLLKFFQLCLDQHMRKGSRMSSYIDFKQFKKNYNQFEDLIASRPDVSYTQEIIFVKVPSNCKYYSGNEALVLTLYKN